MAVTSGSRATLTALVLLSVFCSVAAENQWSEWYNSDRPYSGNEVDEETLHRIFSMGYQIPCTLKDVVAVECRQVNRTMTFSGQRVFGGNVLYIPCNLTGLVCRTVDQTPAKKCEDYEIRAACPATTVMTKTNATQLGVYATSGANVTTTKPSSTSADYMGANGGFIAMAAGGSVIVPLVCVLVIQLKKSKRLERMRREAARQAAVDLREAEEQRNALDRPPAYEELFGSTTLTTTTTNTDGTGSSSRGSSGRHPSETMSMVSGSLSVDSGLGLEGDHLVDRTTAYNPVRGNQVNASSVTSTSASSSGPTVSVLNGRTSLVSTTLSSGASAPSSPGTEPPSAIAILSPGTFSFNTSNLDSLMQFRSVSPLAAANNQALATRDNAPQSADMGVMSSASSDTSSDGGSMTGQVVVAMPATSDTVTPSNTVIITLGPTAQSQVPVSSDAQDSRRSSSGSTFSHLSGSSTDVLLPPVNAPAPMAELSATDDGTFRARFLSTSSDPGLLSEPSGVVAAAMGGGNRRSSFPHNDPPPTYDMPSYRHQTTPFAVLPASFVPIPPSDPPDDRFRSTGSAPILARLSTPTSSSSSTSQSQTTGQVPAANNTSRTVSQQPLSRTGAAGPSSSSLTTSSSEPSFAVSPSPYAGAQRTGPARGRFLGMHLSIFELMAAIYQTPTQDNTSTPPPTYDDALKILASGLQGKRENRDPNQNL